MTTVTGDFAIDWSGVGDTDPYTDSDFTAEGAAAFKVESGALEPKTGGDSFFALTGVAHDGGNIFNAKIEVSFGDTANASNPLGPCVFDSSGNGYGIYLAGAQTRIRRYAAYTAVSFVAFTSVAYSAGDTFEITLNASTGALDALKNGVSYSTGTDTTYTSGFRPGVHGSIGSNPSVNGAVSFAADNLALAPTITTIDPDPATTGAELTITGTLFESVQGTGGVTQEQGAVVVALTESAWADTSITADSATIESTGLKYGSQTLRVTNDSSDDVTGAFVSDPAAGNDFVDLTSVATVGQIITILALAVDDQLRYENVTTPGGYAVVVNPDATFTIDGSAVDGVYTFEVRAWDDSDQTWGTAADQSVTIGAAPITGDIINTRLSIGIGIGI